MGEGHTRLTQVQRFERARRLRQMTPEDDTGVSPGTLVTALVAGAAIILTAAATADLSP